MGNSGSSAPTDSNDVLVHSFQLDADTDFCSLPICCPGKQVSRRIIEQFDGKPSKCSHLQAMFHKPRNFSAHLENFIPYAEGGKMIEEINTILRDTAFPNRQCNPFFILCMLLSFLSIGPSILNMMSQDSPDSVGSSVTFILLGVFLPYIPYFGLMIYKRISRKNCLLNFVCEWNEKKSDGVFISLGGGGTIRGNAVGSETGGTYDNFY